MSGLLNIKRPHPALINAVEAVGVLLGIELTMAKSAYKAKAPSNYDATVEYLHTNFSEAIMKLAQLDTDGISNKTASELYRKIQSCPFDYESAVISGGLEAREMFNILMHILDRLTVDPHRIPIRPTNVLTIVDGSRPSYVALDIAAHMHQHGVCVIGALTYAEEDGYESRHLQSDLTRRCKDLYKMEEKSFKIVPVNCVAVAEIVRNIESLFEENNCGVVAMGIDTSNPSEDELALAVTYSAWKMPHRIILAKSFARVCEFESIQSPRIYQVAVKNTLDLNRVFQEAVPFINPGDRLVLLAIVDNGDPIGDARDTRFGFGERFDKWSVGRRISTDTEPDRPGWNDAEIATLKERMEYLLSKSQVSGKAIVITRDITKTIAQMICDIAFEESVDVLVVRRGENREVSRECLQRAHCNVLLTS